MSEFIKKLKTSKPDVTGTEAYETWIQVLESIENQSYLYHSHTHGREQVLDLIDVFINTYAKIGKSKTEYVLSYQPYAILYWDFDPFRWWVSLYSNGMIMYVEDDTASDIMLYIAAEEVEKVMGDGAKK